MVGGVFQEDLPLRVCAVALSRPGLEGAWSPGGQSGGGNQREDQQGGC